MKLLRAIENFLFRLLDRLIGINQPEIYSIPLIDEPEPQQMTTDEIMLGILIARSKQNKDNVQ
tara:strand:- start:392 stop:580 length:189 start_codon:yes stop_codon:yes gene_type:complete